MHTTIEQSERLIELGIDVKTADMLAEIDDRDYPSIDYNITIYRGQKKDLPLLRYDGIPIWSLSALFNLIPSEIKTIGKFGEFKYQLHIRKYKFADNVDVHQLAYGNYNDGGSWSDMISTSEEVNFIDAAFEMVCWLLENKMI